MHGRRRDFTAGQTSSDQLHKRKHIPDYTERPSDYKRDGVSGEILKNGEGAGTETSVGRPLRADAQRNLETLLKTALEVFSASGVDAPMKEIADKAGVGVGTIYRHFPQRSDLITAVFRREIDACAEAASTIAAEHDPFGALAAWVQRYVGFIAAKRGLAAALHSGDRAYEALPAYFDKTLQPPLQRLLDAAVETGQIRDDVKPNELLRAIGSLCSPAPDVDPDYSRNMVDLLLDGLRWRDPPS
jgi:AcrR family transcriptional regulator